MKKALVLSLGVGEGKPSGTRCSLQVLPPALTILSITELCLAKPDSMGGQPVCTAVRH